MSGAKFITFEGLDGSGKSTHLERARRWLEEQGVPCRATREPGGTALGQEIRNLFLDRRWGEMDGRVEALLVFASRRQHLIEVIEPALAAGRHVLSDRFTDSTLVYQGLGRGLPRAWVDDLDRLATGGRRPDHTLLFDLPAAAARARGQSATRGAEEGGIDRIDAEEIAFYRLVRNGYLELVGEAPERFSVIDSSGDREATWSQVERCLREILR